MLILGMNMIGIWLGLLRTKLTTQIFVIGIYKKLIGVPGIVAKTIIEIIIYDAGACAERYLTLKVGKEVETVMVVMLHYGERSVENHPVYEICKLTQTSPKTMGGSAVGYCETFTKTMLLVIRSNEAPERKRLTGTYHNAIHTWSCKRQIHSFVLLQPHLGIAEPAAYKRIVFIYKDR